MTIKPRQRQIDFMNWRYGLFIHFGPYTWYPYENVPYEALTPEEPVSPDLFSPDALDCSKWAVLAKQCNFKHMILTVRHQDGLCLWPTSSSSPAVNKISWADGKRDVVREYVDACRAQGLKIGFYYSSLDLTGNKNELIHLEELLGNYGKIDYLFFDGYGSDRREYNFQAMAQIIRRLQPEIILSNGFGLATLLFFDGDPDVGWIGNEEGLTEGIDFTSLDTYMCSKYNGPPEIRQCYIIPSAFVRIRNKYWFFDNGHNDPLKSIEDLMNIYNKTYKKGLALSINVAPDRHGLIPEEEQNLLLEFSKICE